MSDALEVWLDCDLAEIQQVGTLYHDRGQTRFQYKGSWLNGGSAFMLDPDLSLDAAPFFPKPETGNFGIFLDSSPDRWGQMLMKRRESLQAKDEGRTPRNLYAWDYLLGVQDVTRQGALRFRREGTEIFLDAERLAAPPVTSLRELESIAIELTGKRLNDLGALRRWLSVLVAPGASLGGARPKANFMEQDGTLWIAKFPSREDHYDAGTWEYVLYRLATDAGIEMPEARLAQFGDSYHTYCVRRFDRNEQGGRMFYASAMTLLRKDVSEGTSYLELAQFLRNHGDESFIEEGLAQLFRRVAFNVVAGNRDDHLRNHGFIIGKKGWRLSPAFDLNPNIDKADHVLNIDDKDNRPDMATVLATAGFYGLDASKARGIVDEVLSVVAGWRREASHAGVAKADIELMSTAFAV